MNSKTLSSSHEQGFTTFDAKSMLSGPVGECAPYGRVRCCGHHLEVTSCYELEAVFELDMYTASMTAKSKYEAAGNLFWLMEGFSQWRQRAQLEATNKSLQFVWAKFGSS